MEPTTDPAPTAPPGTGNRAQPIRVLVAGLVAMVLVAAAAGIAIGHRHRSSRPALVLEAVDRSASVAPVPDAGGSASGGPAIAPVPTAFRYRMTIAAPDLGSRAPVARLTAPAVDNSRLRSMGHALHMQNVGIATAPAGGWTVRGDGSAQLHIDPVAGGWTVRYSADGGTLEPGSVGSSPGSPPAGGANDSTGTTIAPRPPGLVPATPLENATPPTMEPTPNEPEPPIDLPNATDAEQIARTLLEHMGITGDWVVSLNPTTFGDAPSCAPEPCATPGVLVLGSRTVNLQPKFDGDAVAGLSWQVDVGDQGTIQRVSGTWTDFQTLGDYPLRSVASVFADLAAGGGIDPQPLPVASSPPPGQKVEPVDVAIDHVSSGYAVMAASDHGHNFVDIVPTYVFTGRIAAGDDVSRSLLSVAAKLAPANSVPTPTEPDSAVPVPAPDTPTPQPAPLVTPTVAGVPPR